ncbi:MAG: type II toxin-antitoxin system VapC family toxin [Nanoarchaeota archaeon]
MYCLDTNIIIEFFKGNERIIKKIKENLNNQFFTTLSLCELYKGAFLSKNKEKELINIQTLLDYLELVTLNMKSAEIFGEKYKLLQDLGKMTQEFDLLNASIALAYDLTFVTLNKRHFINIPGLKIEEW